MISRQSAFLAVMLLLLCTLAHGAEPMETFRTNLDPLIDRAMRHRTQFAVDVARRIDSESSGKWQTDGGNVVWDYSIRIPTAVSMAFHASRLLLPQQGTLTIAGGGQTFVYKGRDLHRAEFWSRPVKGDQIAVRITVAKEMRHQALIEIAAFQAGYKSLAAGIADHPHYTALKAHVAAAAAGCVENYVCDATVSTQSSANASVAVVISNKFACSGTLLNDVPQDGTPYVLTARHCENGEDAGGDPGAAASVEIFWNSVTPCGQSLLSIFDSFSQIQTGGTTMVEQQDEWLIRLDTQPAFSNVYYAGWDASGSNLVDGYSVDYSGADTQQYVTWVGMAVTEDFSAQDLGVGYASTYWGVVNSLGSIDHGGSGSGLFNSNNLLVGSASRAIPAQCPANPPPVPSKNTTVALFNKLASTFNSTVDVSSTTGSATLASVLDPAHTGASTMAGIAGSPPTAEISALQSAAQTGGSVQLRFSGSAGAVCTATGGVAGDGWSGVLTAYPADYSSVTETTAGVITYGMTCVSGSRSSSAQVTVTWSLAPPTLMFYDQTGGYGLYPGIVNPFVWNSNQASCVATGGATGDGWGGALPGSGQVNVTESLPGTYLYTLTCGTGSQAISQTLNLTYSAPTASLQLFAQPGLRFGQSIWLLWNGSGNCTASGGGAGDNWSGPLTSNLDAVYLTEQAAGTYVYTISCGPAAIAATSQVSYTFTGGPPAASLTAAQPTQLIDLSVEEYPALLTWTSNVQPCAIDYTGPVNGNVLSGYPSQGTDTEPQQIAGTYTYTLTCGTGATLATSTATIDWVQQPDPKVTLSTEDGNEFLLSGGYLYWTTNVLPCVGSGGTPGDGWNGKLPYYGGPGNSSAALISEPTAGTYTFTITCGVGNTASAQATAMYNNLGGSVLTLTPGGTDVVFEGQPALLTWNSSVGPCTGYGGTAGDGWSGSHSQQGNIGVVEPLGFESYLSLVCGTGTNAVEAQTRIWVYRPATQIQTQLGSNSSNGVVGHLITLNWNADEAASCTATGGVAGDGWSGTLPWFGSMTVVEAQSGSVSYGLTCQNGSLSGQGSVTVQWQAAPSVTLISSTQAAVLGTPFTLTWSSANGASGCTASEDGGQSGGFSGSLADSGSTSIEETAGAQHTYTILCSSNNGNVQAQVTVNFSAATGTGGSGSTTGGTSSAGTGGHSGGGDLDIKMIGLLALLVAMRFSNSRPQPRFRDRSRVSR
jgi:hypothetical protein